LSLAGSDVLAAPAPAAKPIDTARTAEAPQAVDAPKTDAPKYVERPAAVEPKAETPKAETPKVEQGSAEPAKPAKTVRADKPRRQRYWTEGRIIGELHRHGIYW